jgi:hypothetical protein
MSQPSVLTIRVPRDLKKRIETTAKEQGVSINQLAMYMFSREISSFEAGNKLSDYWSGSEKDEIYEGFDSVMKKVKRRRVPGWDRVR